MFFAFILRLHIVFHVFLCFVTYLRTPKKAKSIKSLITNEKSTKASMFDQILGPAHPTGRGGGGIIFECTESDGGGGRKTADVPSNKSYETFDMVVLYMPIIETGQVRLSSYVGIGFVLNISGSERRLLFTVYHPLSIVDFLFPLTLPKYQDHTILIKV